MIFSFRKKQETGKTTETAPETTKWDDLIEEVPFANKNENHNTSSEEAPESLKEAFSNRLKKLENIGARMSEDEYKNNWEAKLKTPSSELDSASIITIQSYAGNYYRDRLKKLVEKSDTPNTVKETADDFAEHAIALFDAQNTNLDQFKYSEDDDSDEEILKEKQNGTINLAYKSAIESFNKLNHLAKSAETPSLMVNDLFIPSQNNPLTEEQSSQYELSKKILDNFCESAFKNPFKHQINTSSSEKTA